MDSQPQPSLLQVAQNVHKPAAAAPGLSKLSTYPCLSPHCERTFPNAEDLDLHYKLGRHTTDVFGFGGAPLANIIRSTTGEPSQSLHNANLVQNGLSAIGASLNDPFMGHVDYNDISVTEHHRGLLTHDGFRMHQYSPSLSLVNDFLFANEPHVYASSVIGGDQPITSALLPLVSIEAVSTIASPAASLATFSPTPPSQTPITGTLPPPRHVCATCSKTFSRAGDMQRHAKKHNPSAPRIDCPFPGCPYKGAKGFLRSDKLANHRQNRH